MRDLSRRLAALSARCSRTTRGAARFAAVATIALCLVRCGARGESTGAGDANALRATVSHDGDVRTIVLSRSLYDVATDSAGVDVLHADLDLGAEPGTEFGYVSDVAVMDDGTMAVLDRANAEVWLFASTGQLMRRFAGKGKGPGELRSPIAIAAVGHRWVVQEPSIRSTFTVYDRDGQYLTSFNAPLDGDWRSPALNPTLVISGVFEGQENLAGRLSAYDDSTIAVYVQDDALLASTQKKDFPFDAPPGRVVRVNLHGQILDTVAAMTGAPIVHRDVFYGPFYAARPVWAIGNGWTAVAQGDSAVVDVHSSAEGSATRITWPSIDIAIDDELRVGAIKHYVSLQMITSAQSAQIVSRLSPKEVEATERKMADVWPVATDAPQLTAALATGNCLWLAGWNPDDALDGTASTWAVVDLRRGAVERVVRIPRRDSRVRAVNATAVYTTYLDSLGVSHVERYPAAMPECAAP